jgi:hypothetical protein
MAHAPDPARKGPDSKAKMRSKPDFRNRQILPGAAAEHAALNPRNPTSSI